MHCHGWYTGNGRRRRRKHLKMFGFAETLECEFGAKDEKQQTDMGRTQVQPPDPNYKRIFFAMHSGTGGGWEDRDKGLITGFGMGMSPPATQPYKFGFADGNEDVRACGTGCSRSIQNISKSEKKTTTNFGIGCFSFPNNTKPAAVSKGRERSKSLWNGTFCTVDKESLQLLSRNDEKKMAAFGVGCFPKGMNGNRV